MRRCRRFFVIGIFLALGVRVAGATTLFSDDAERGLMEGNVAAGWTINRHGVSATAEEAHSGRFSYVVRSPGASVSSYIGFKSNGADPLYLRCWVMVSDGFGIKEGESTWLCGLTQIPGSWKTDAVNLTNRQGALYLSAEGIRGRSRLSKGEWHVIDLEYSRSGNEVKVWLDGRTEILATGLKLESKDHVLIGANAGTGTIYFDDISVADSLDDRQTAGITVRHAYPGNRIRMKLQSYLWGAAKTDMLISSADGAPFSLIPNPGSYQAPALDVARLSAGDHKIEVRLEDSKRQERAAWTETIRTSGVVPTVGIDENNNLVRGGHKVFPITQWMMNGPDVVAWYKSGYINASGWASEWSGAYSVSQFKRFIEDTLDCKKNHMQVMGAGGRVSRGATETVTYRLYASAFTNHPCFLAWTAFDEADYNNVSATRMQSVLDAVHQGDVNHPFAYDDATQPWLDLKLYYPNLVADIYSTDNYPLCYADHYKASGKTFADWVAMMDRDDAANYGIVPNFVVLELYKFAAPERHMDCGQITAKTVFNEAWLAVIHNRKGVSWYDNGSSVKGYGPVCKHDSDASCFPANPKEHIGKFVSQIARITPDVVLAAPTGRTILSDRTDPGSRVDVAVREDGSSVWVFAARLTDVIRDPIEATAAPLATKITLSGLGDSTAEVFDERRSVRMTGGVIEDSFAPYAVHIYRIPINGQGGERVN